MSQALVKRDSDCCTVANWRDGRGNLCPVKKQPEQKLDAAVVLMTAVGRAMVEDDGHGDLMDFLRNPVVAWRAA